MASRFERSPILKSMVALRKYLPTVKRHVTDPKKVSAALMGYVGFVALVIIAKFLVPS